jgi:K+-sensing histidine kinase KdpD
VSIKCEIVYAEGKPVVKSITEYASKNQIDLIVIGGGDVSQRVFLIVGGSIAVGVVKKSQCPVVVMLSSCRIRKNEYPPYMIHYTTTTLKEAEVLTTFLIS